MTSGVFAGATRDAVTALTEVGVVKEGRSTGQVEGGLPKRGAETLSFPLLVPHVRKLISVPACPPFLIITSFLTSPICHLMSRCVPDSEVSISNPTVTPTLAPRPQDFLEWG